ncbi:MAG: Protein kinase C-like 1 [Vezdaea aestivalis]|nr:MAG: Protein kinase C-like 1 [Vezdaea aestivalis]
MVSSNSVNKTALHPGGVQPIREHTEIEEELHESANIDYDRVAIVPNPSVAALYEDALVYESGSAITSNGALTAHSGAKTGRSPLDKRIVKEPTSDKDVWWGPVNRPMKPEVWRINRERAIDYLNTRDRIYVVDGYAGWDERYRISVRVVCARAYHALFMRNMLIRPSLQELEHFHPDYVIYNAGTFPANRYTQGMTSATSVAINFADKEMVILGTEYAGEMKKGIFTVLFYEMPVKHDVLTLHSSANEGEANDVTVFFGLSGTGKTTLSADPKRKLIGDDEHCWSDRGIFNIEGGCYAKCIGLTAEKEPDIFNAIRFGSVLENVVFDPETRVVDYNDTTLTENTRCAYPIEYIENAKIPCVTDNHPSNMILLTCDASGVLPPISKLTTEQTMFHFISGYTSKMAGTEDGVTEPTATFSSCFAQPFLALHPMRYAKMLAEKIEQHKANAWLLNTGWTGAGVTKGGKRCPLKYTRAILDAIHSGELAKAEFEVYDTFNLHVPKTITGVPSELLNPQRSWINGEADFRLEVNKLAGLFNENFKKYADQATSDVINAGPKIKAEAETSRPAPVETASNGTDPVAKKEGAPNGAEFAPTNGVSQSETTVPTQNLLKEHEMGDVEHHASEADLAKAIRSDGRRTPAVYATVKKHVNIEPVEVKEVSNGALEVKGASDTNSEFKVASNGAPEVSKAQVTEPTAVEPTPVKEVYVNGNANGIEVKAVEVKQEETNGHTA